MSIFKIWYNGDYEDEVFSTEEDAEEYALELVSCARLGAEILNMSNPGDYDVDDYEDEYRIDEFDD